MVTHEPAVAAFAREAAILKDGRLVQRFALDGQDAGQ
jgi:ABC-type lipoprotein export system ATPase subunit